MPGNRYVQVLNTYLTRRLLMAVMLGTLVICLIQILAWWFVGNAGAVDRTQAMFMFGFFLAFPAMFIGAHVKQQLATHEASLVPGYRVPHLVVAALTFLVPLLFAFLTAPLVGGSFVGYAALQLLVCLALFHVSADASRWAGLCVAAIYLPAIIPQMRTAIEQVLAGELPGLASCLLSAEAAVAVLLFHRLANLTEDDPSYGNVMPMNVWDMRASEVRRRNRAQLQKSRKVMLSLIEAESRRLDRLTAEPARTRSQRVALLQMAGDWPINLMSVFVMILLMESLPLLAPRLGYRTHLITSSENFAVALAWPMMLSLGTAWILWLPQSQRWSRLGYESLRPSTRKEWILENGVAMIRKTLAMQVVWLPVQVVLLFAFLPTFATSPAIANGLIYLTGVHVAIFGAGAWISSFGSMFWKVVGFFIFCGALQPSWLAISSWSLTYSWQIPLFAAIIAGVGVGLTFIGYRRWCRIDLM